MRLIDADALMVQLANKHAHSWGKVERAFGEVAEMLNNAPTIDAEPVRHGEWVKHPDESCSLFNGWECSACGQIVSGGKGNYCPNCGAKMDGGENDE